MPDGTSVQGQIDSPTGAERMEQRTRDSTKSRPGWAWESRMPLKLNSTQRIVDEKNRIVMAEGRMALLELIVSTGSINQAAKRMKMSYKSAWSKIRSTEKHLKTKIVSSNRATGTRLTAAGEGLLRKYRQLKWHCMAADDAIFDAVFGGGMAPRPLQCLSHDPPPPIVSFVGHSGSGKTTIVEKVIARLAARRPQNRHHQARCTWL
jgi:molybdate transport system regulatory protein